MTINSFLLDQCDREAAVMLPLLHKELENVAGGSHQGFPTVAPSIEPTCGPELGSPCSNDIVHGTD